MEQRTPLCRGSRSDIHAPNDHVDSKWPFPNLISHDALVEWSAPHHGEMPALRAKAELLIVGERSAGLLLPALRAVDAVAHIFVELEECAHVE